MLRDKMRWTAYSDLLEDEYRQCLQEGLQVEPLLEEIRRIQTLSDGSLREEEARSLLARLEAAPVRSDFPYEEPEDYESIQSTLRPTAHKIWPVDADHFTDRIAGAWYGRTVGCVLGIPVEGWPRSKITGYLKASGQYPITEYLHSTQDPALRAQFDIHEEDPTTPYDRTRVCWLECLDAYPNDDDLNYTVLALKLLERYGHNFTSADVAETWLLGIPAFHACTAERVAIRNLMTGTPPQSVPGVDRCTNPCGLLRLYCSRQSSGSRGHGLSGRGGLPYQKRRLWGNVHCCLAQFVLCGGSDYAPAGAKCLGADSASFALIRSHFRGLRLLCLRCFLPKRGRRNPCPLRRNPAI